MGALGLPGSPGAAGEHNVSLGTTAPDYNNVLTGTPTQAGTFSFLIQVTDTQGNSVNATETITINP